MKKALELLSALGKIHHAKRLIRVSSAQVSGVSYKTIGDSGIEFLRELAGSGAKARIPATLNPAGVEFGSHSQLEFPDFFVEKQREIVKLYTDMGVLPSCTCTPYYGGNLPRLGESVAWAESSAVIYANSVLGARSNRESALSALAAAIVGKIPRYGLHLEENRAPTFVVDVAAPMLSEADFAALGYYVGQRFEGVPYFRVRRKPRGEELKTLGAALATGKVSMFHCHRVTPEASLYSTEGLEVVEITPEQISETYRQLNSTQDVDIVAVGCPHSSIQEVREVIEADPKREVWVFTSRHIKELFKDRVENQNIKLISDTCMVVAPLEEMGIKSIGVNSAKAAFYSSHLSNLKVRFDSLENLLRE